VLAKDVVIATGKVQCVGNNTQTLGPYPGLGSVRVMRAVVRDVDIKDAAAAGKFYDFINGAQNQLGWGSLWEARELVAVHGLCVRVENLRVSGGGGLRR
jgi:hypothetical protein